MQTFPQDYDEATFLERGRGAVGQWAWPDRDKGQWEAVDDNYQEFYNKWRAPDSSSEFHKEFPYQLSLGQDSRNMPLLPFRSGDPNGYRLLVTESYNNLFHRILKARRMDKGVTRGVVLIGEPGVGKTTFLKFMLARLISAQQVVLLCDDSATHLFYRGGVYIRPTEPHGFMNLPAHAPHNPIWALIDVGYEDRGPPLTGSTGVWPIQASSPNPVRFKSWSKQDGATLLGMPPWSMMDLVEALCLQPGYDNLRSRLEEYLLLLDGSTLPATGDRTFDAALQVLQAERGKREVGGWDNDCDVVEAMAVDRDENMVGKAAQPPAHKVDDAIKVLVRNATEEFGFAPSDVYKGVFLPGELKIQHAEAVRDLDYVKLKKIVSDFSLDRKLSDLSSRIVAVHPSPSYGYRSDTWTIEFKSVRIAEKVANWMQSEEDSHLQDMFNSFYRTPAGSSLAGWIFKAIVHRMFSGGWQSGEPAPQPICMSSQGHPPTFFTRPSPSSPFDVPPPLRAETRAIVQVNFTADSLGDVTLKGDNYYILTTTCSSLFDSFTIDVEDDTARISIFRITASEEHGGSAVGYHRIGRIKTRIHDLLVEEGITHPVVTTTYFLVCPNDKPRQWKIPDGWDSQYHGRAFSIGIPSQYVTGKPSFLGAVRLSFAPVSSQVMTVGDPSA